MILIGLYSWFCVLLAWSFPCTYLVCMSVLLLWIYLVGIVLCLDVAAALALLGCKISQGARWKIALLWPVSLFKDFTK
jgi:hypothetical protein